MDSFNVAAGAGQHCDVPLSFDEFFGGSGFSFTEVDEIFNTLGGNMAPVPQLQQTVDNFGNNDDVDITAPGLATFHQSPSNDNYYSAPAPAALPEGNPLVHQAQQALPLHGAVKTSTISCTTCKQRVESVGHLSRHMECHQLNNKKSRYRCLQCTTCFTTFSRKLYLERHIRMTPGHTS